VTMPDPYNESWRDFVNLHRANWNGAWLPLPAPRDVGHETIPDYATRCATWGDAPLSATQGYREWRPTWMRANPPVAPEGSGGNSPPPPPPDRQ
jgi:hypothetical protein